MKRTTTIKLCNDALNSCASLIARESSTEISEYINKYNEWSVGIELLIDLLIEDQKKISENQFQLIETAMSAMDLENSERVIHLRQCIE